MTLDDSLADSQPYTAAALVGLVALAALEQVEDDTLIALRDASTVVGYGDMPKRRLFPHSDSNHRMLCGSLLDCVADQILKELHQLNMIGDDGCGGLDDDIGTGLANSVQQVLFCPMDGVLYSHGGEHSCRCVHGVRPRQQIADHRSHSCAGAHDKGKPVAHFIVPGGVP